MNLRHGASVSQGQQRTPIGNKMFPERC